MTNIEKLIRTNERWRAAHGICESFDGCSQCPLKDNRCCVGTKDFTESDINTLIEWALKDCE